MVVIVSSHLATHLIFLSLIIPVWFKTVAFQSHSSLRRFLLSQESLRCCLFVCLLIKDFLDTCANFALPRVGKRTELCAQSHTVTHQDKQERMHMYALTHTPLFPCVQLHPSYLPLSSRWLFDGLQVNNCVHIIQDGCDAPANETARDAWPRVFRPPSHSARHLLLTQMLFSSPSNLIMSIRELYPLCKCVCVICYCWLIEGEMPSTKQHPPTVKRRC